MDQESVNRANGIFNAFCFRWLCHTPTPADQPEGLNTASFSSSSM